MHPLFVEVLAQDHIAEMHRHAAQHRLVRRARRHNGERLRAPLARLVRVLIP